MFGCQFDDCEEPPDPGVAVGGNDVVQSTNDGIRIYARSGQLLVDAPLWAFFAEPLTTVASSDPRIVYDELDKRWFGTELSWDCSTGYLSVAVSETGDPTGFWDVYQLDFSGLLPGFPQPGYSSAGFAIGYNLYTISSCDAAGFVGAQLLDIDIGDLEAGANLHAEATSANAGLFSYAPTSDQWPGRIQAPVQIFNGSATDVGMTSIDGLVANGTLSISTIDLTTSAPNVAAFVEPPTPVVFSGAPSPPIDSRPTDAFAANGDTAFVSTTSCVPIGDTSTRACLRVTQLRLSGGMWSVVEDYVVAAAGRDTFTGGLNFSSDQSIVLVYSQAPAVAGSTIDTYVAAHSSSDAPDTIHAPAVLAKGAAGYRGARWGDFVVVPTDWDVGGVWQADEQVDARGDWSTTVSQLLTQASGVPAGTVTLQAGPPNDPFGLVVDPAAAQSPFAAATQVLVSNTGTTTGGSLDHARQYPLSHGIRWDLADPDTGGSTTTGTRSVFVQFGDGSGVWSSVVTSSITIPPLHKVTRLAGGDRYGTATAIGAATFRVSPSVVFVATGTGYADALAGAAVAAHLGAPLVLVTAATVPSGTASFLTAMQPDAIVVLGGTGVVSTSVRNQLDTYTLRGTYQLAGSDRYQTAAAISAANFDPGVPVAFVATGLNFPDALTGAVAAGRAGGPILLVAGTTVPSSTASELGRLKPGKIVVLGGPGAVSDGVRSQLAAYVGGDPSKVERWYGGDRFATAVAISQHTDPTGRPIAVYVATGANFPDALAGASAAGYESGPILLVMTDQVPAVTATELTRLRPHRIVVLGGTGVVSAAVATQLAAYAVP